ncbi:hypothetical protein CO131_00480 [Candidatus Kaiserbacteria bacterium CG_4_9_14_3_um_filter_50_16]|uniref:Uncharacterized protein n=1 Tax=Candidatus Kaiserbacteria bacterium CG08_land_8_20_14_0_20_50_21 TaxID=1974604 RepID=A0A2H0YY73_9BACT|nr:MAG: hypothetical protein AUJ45_01975 [Parcubacteria group bacterium CG1_02_50_68]PIS43269.1 MAG: hypothetical protein COT23_02085 [Candidatus Kaiserbacteria bacterium CG08_land_8_20_14_0_20_50_21]PIU81814.1 MAG: hypothetical protein COS69_02055 [Candidatus Kaiserbacteria bacterium CG06_land_8_20_14_3_00_49_31]PIW96155.1 MAG: hypothetical protein COZ83_02375 [Candidatus Kaiserbacteria bacterium CG_4_8_14_3_um_filter_50_23]PJA94606.1 MAG: hypothetical protein CO131_00480 [Candidatus Kaiserbac
MNIKKFLLEMFFGKKKKSFEDFVEEVSASGRTTTVVIRPYKGIRGYVLEFKTVVLLMNKVVFVERLFINEKSTVDKIILKRQGTLRKKGHEVWYNFA